MKLDITSLLRFYRALVTGATSRMLAEESNKK